jgi:RES domain-containing protein
MKPELPEVQALFDIIAKQRLAPTTFEGVLYRSVGTRYANEKDFLTGAGAAYYGGRWNPPRLAAVYGSMEIDTAVAEAFQNFPQAGFSLSAIRPRVIAAVDAKLRVVFDLTDSTNRRRIGFRRSDLIEEDWKAIQDSGEESWTQCIARGCFAAGFEAIVVPSARRREGKNIVVFPSALKDGSRLKIVGASDLPPHPDNW